MASGDLYGGQGGGCRGTRERSETRKKSEGVFFEIKIDGPSFCEDFVGKTFLKYFRKKLKVDLFAQFFVPQSNQDLEVLIKGKESDAKFDFYLRRYDERSRDYWSCCLIFF